MSARIIELAIPKGNVAALCELCGSKATTKCEECRVTHYCSLEHKRIDDESFHRKVCKKMADIRTEQTLPFSEEDRLVAKQNLLEEKEEIKTKAEQTARKWLLQEKPNNAYPAAMIALNMARELAKPDSMEMIYPTCLVSEMFLGLKDLPAAREYMIQASWLAQKYDTIPGAILTKLYRIRGLVFMATDKWTQARTDFAEFIYATASDSGIRDIKMAIAYGYLGLVLMRFHDVDGAVASFHKMADRWLEVMLSQWEDNLVRRATEAEMTLDPNTRELEFQFLESKIVFKLAYESIRICGMNDQTDKINFKILSLQVLAEMKEYNPDDAVVFKEEALATAIRTKQDEAVSEDRAKLLMEVLGQDYILLWEKKHNRPRTVATKYLEQIKAINV